MHTLCVLYKATFLSLTINANLAVSVFVCGFEEGFCLTVSQISAVLGKAPQYEPE